MSLMPSESICRSQSAPCRWRLWSAIGELVAQRWFTFSVVLGRRGISAGPVWGGTRQTLSVNSVVVVDGFRIERRQNVSPICGSSFIETECTMAVP